MQILLYNNNDDAEVSFPIFSFIFFFLWKPCTERNSFAVTRILSHSSFESKIKNIDAYKHDINRSKYEK
jgi:hypothetical protein